MRLSRRAGDGPGFRHLFRTESALPRDFFSARIVLLIFMVAGDRLLHAMRLIDASFEIAGGVILFLIAMGMAFPGVTG